MLKKVVFAALVAATLLAPNAAAQSSATYKYTLATGVSVSGVGTGLVSSDLCYPEALLGERPEGWPDFSEVCHIGGVEIYPNGELPVAIRISDSSGGPVAYTVCQDIDGDHLCGEEDANEGSMEGCGMDIDLTQSALPFVSTAVTAVFISAFNDACPGIGTNGVVTIFYDDS